MMWRRRLGSYVPGQIGVSEWCAQNGVARKTFYYWRQRLNQPTGTEHETDWLTVTSVDEPESKADCRLAASGVSLRIGSAAIELAPGFDENVLSTVIRVLEGAKC
jgi:transposase-like protein